MHTMEKTIDMFVGKFLNWLWPKSIQQSSEKEIADAVDRCIVEVNDITQGRVIRFQRNGYDYYITRTAR